jgi:Putative peptidoglycan binding domain
MAEFSLLRLSPARRVVLIAAAVVVVGGAVGGGVAVAGNSHGAASSPGGTGSVTTAPVVRTTLVNTVQQGGSLSYGGSYTVTAPSGASAAQISQQEQLVAQDKQAVSGDEQAMSDSLATGNQSVAAAQANVKIAQSTLSADQAAEAKDCAGSGGSAQSYADTPLSATFTGIGTLTPSPSSSATGSTAPSPSSSAPPPSSPPPSSGPPPSPSPTGSGTGGTGNTGGSACSQDQQKVTQDQNQLTQAQQQLASAETTGKTTSDQAQSKAAADQVKLQGDEAALAQLRETAMNPGTAYTWLPAAGAVIRQGQPAYQVSGEPVPLLYGAIPAYRAFYVGMSDGGDVGELTHDLITLGFGAGLAQGDHYSSATAAAVQRWQRKLGLPQTGEILLGEVVFKPGPMRVTSVTPTAGSSYGSGGGGGGGAAGGGGGGGGGTVLAATGITPVVTVSLAVTQEYLVKPGDAVSVVLPNGTSTAGGHVESVGTVATCSGGGTTGTGGSGNSGGSGSSPCSSSGSSGSAGSNSTPTVTVTISLDSTPPGAALDQAPVNVNITAQSVGNVLAVPVNALLALSGGGYGVDVVSGGAAHLVGVTTGLYSSTLVQVSGSGIAAGELVEVPSS